MQASGQPEQLGAEQRQMSNTVYMTADAQNVAEGQTSQHEAERVVDIDTVYSFLQKV